MKLTGKLGVKRYEVMWLSYDCKLGQAQGKRSKSNDVESSAIDIKDLKLMVYDGQGLLVGLLEYMKKRRGTRLEAATIKCWHIGY